jgi:hypothetical protein
LLLLILNMHTSVVSRANPAPSPSSTYFPSFKVTNYNHRRWYVLNNRLQLQESNAL